MTTLTEQLDNLYTTTWQDMKGALVDNIYDATPFWFWMNEGDRLESVEGGRFLTEPLRFAKSDNIRWFSKGKTVPMGDQEFMTIAKDDWRYVSDTVVRWFQDDQQNRSKHQIISIMESKLENSQDSLVDEMENRLFGKAADGTGEESGRYPNGLQDLVADDPTTGTLHSLDASTETWWQSQTKDMTGLSYAVHGVPEMRTMLNNCSNNLRMDRPNIIVSGQTPYEYYEDDVTEQKRIVNKTLGDAGFENIEFKGIPMIWSPACANTRKYFLNTDFLKWKYDPMVNFDMTDWKPIPQQVNDRAAQIVLAGQLMTSRRRCHGVMHTIDTE